MQCIKFNVSGCISLSFIISKFSSLSNMNFGIRMWCSLSFRSKEGNTGNYDVSQKYICIFKHKILLQSWWPTINVNKTLWSPVSIHSIIIEKTYFEKQMKSNYNDVLSSSGIFFILVDDRKKQMSWRLKLELNLIKINFKKL